MLLEENDVAGVGAKEGVGHVAKEGDEADDEVDDDVEHHLDFDTSGEAAVDFAACFVDHEGHEEIEEIADAAIISGLYRNDCCVGETYAGMIPIALPQPNLIPRNEKRAMSRRYARRLALVRTWPSWTEMPGGSAFLRLVILPVGLPLSLVAGTCSK